MPSDVQIQGAQQFRKLAQQLGKLDKDLSKQLRLAVRDATKPLLEATRAEAGKHSKSVAKSLVLQVFPTAKGGARVAIVASRSKMKKGHEAFPALLEGASGNPFRHPVHGNKNVWVNQDAHPFLAATILPRIDGVINVIGKTLDDYAQKALSVVGQGSHTANTRRSE